MLALLTSPEYAIFSIALIVMLGIGTIEAIGLGLGHLDVDADLDGDVGGDSLLGWLGLKTGLPILIWLTAFLGCFTLIGFAIQQTATGVTGAPLHWAIAGGTGLIIGGILNAYISSGLARLMPEYESTVIDTEDLIMRRATVLEGASRRGHPARAKVVDQHGQAHYVMVEPHRDSDIIAQGETALLVRRAGPTFFIQPDTDTILRPL
jgi:hypothetical protein